MPTKLPHNCEACSKLSAPQARQKNCWEDKRCPDRRSYHRKKATTAIRRKEQRQNSSIDMLSGADGQPFDLAIPDTYAAELCLWINLSNRTIHAIGAKLYCGGVMTDVEIEIDRDPKLNRSSIPGTHITRQFQETKF
jgi:hypothetical protein